MSYTTLYTIRRDTAGNMVAERTFNNAWGAAPYVWSALAGAYQPGGGSNPHSWERTWEPEYMAKYTAEERLVMETTFDKAVVPREKFPEVASAMQAFVRKYPAGNKVCHLPAIAECLDALYGDPDVRAVAFQQTSVVESQWEIYDEEQDDYRPYNIDTDTGHFFVGEAPE